jgi:hypothetical protein
MNLVPDIKFRWELILPLPVRYNEVIVYVHCSIPVLPLVYRAQNIAIDTAMVRVELQSLRHPIFIPLHFLQLFFTLHESTVLFFVGFQILTAVLIRSAIFWDTTPCSPLKVNLRFGRIYHLHLQGQISQVTQQRESKWQAN